MDEYSFNQAKADRTGKTYYLVTSGKWACKLWATCETEAEHIICTLFPELLGSSFKFTTITQPKNTQKGD